MRGEAVREAHRRITAESARVASGECSHVDLVGCAVDAARQVYAEELRAKGRWAEPIGTQTKGLFAAADLLTQGDDQ